MTVTTSDKIWAALQVLLTNHQITERGAQHIMKILNEEQF